jgi:hypothetical protein
MRKKQIQIMSASNRLGAKQMKKLLVLCGLCLCAAGAASAQDVRGGIMYVTAKSTALKSSTGFFARTQSTLSYGAEVRILQVNGKWREVQSALQPGQRGWTAAASLTAKRIVSGSSTSASAREIALAGKGFNQEVEDAYKTKSKLNYSGVDKTEALAVSPQELKQFLDEGRLNTGD